MRTAAGRDESGGGDVVGEGRSAVSRRAGDIDQTSEHGFTHRHEDRAARCTHGRPAIQPVGRLQRQRAHRVFVQMSLHFRDDRHSAIGEDGKRFFDERQRSVVERDIHDRTPYRDYAALRSTNMGRGHGLDAYLASKA